MVVTLLVTEIGYELVFIPLRHKHVQYMQAVAVGLLVYAALTILLLADYQNQAAQAGLVATGMIVGIGNVIMCALYMYYIARASRGKVTGFIVRMEEWVYAKLHRRLARYVAMVPPVS